MENIFDGLVEFPSNKEFENYLDNITKKDALKLMELAILYMQKSGQFTLIEAYTMHRCLKKMKENDNTN